VDAGWDTVDPDKQTASQHLENVSHARNHCTYLACPTHADYYGGGGVYSRVLEGDDFL
jgi:hypothetical protein